MTDPLDQAPVGAHGSHRHLLPPFSTDDPAGQLPGAWSEIAEIRAANAIRRVLDQGTDQLPLRVTERLHAARQQALAKVMEVPARTGQSAARAAPYRAGEPGTSLSLRWQLGAMAASLMLMAGVFVLVDTIKEEQSVEELAEVDSALLTDDLPLDAYADRGFGVYLVNTRLPQTQPVSFNIRR